jgi:hypothetical protein
MVAVMGNPSFAEHLAAESALPLLAIPTVSAIGLTLLELECMRGRAEGHNGPAPLHVFDNVLHLVVREIPEPREDDQQVSMVQDFEPWDIVSAFRVDGAISRINREQHGALEPVVTRQDFGQLGQRFLRTIFFIPADQHNVFAPTRALSALEDNAGSAGRNSGRQSSDRH